MDIKDYHYTECGLDNIYLLNGFELTKTKEGEEISIHDINGLHKTIGMILASKQGLLLGKELRFIRHMLDLSQKAFASLIGVEPQTVGRWERDEVIVSMTADHFIKMIFLAYIEVPDIYNRINEIAEIDAKEDLSMDKLVFEEDHGKWRMSA